MEKHTTIISSDEPVEIKIGGDHRWFRMFSSVIETGVWSRLSPAAAKILVTIAKYADSNWMAWPGISSLQVSAGVSRRSVYRSLDELERVGLLLRRRRGGGTFGSVYQLLPPVIEKDLFNRQGVQSVAWGVSPLAPGGVTTGTKGVSPLAPELDHRTKPTAATKNSAAAEISELLISVGIGEPVRSEISGSGLDFRKVQSVVSSWRESGKGLGSLVLNLRVAVDQIPLVAKKTDKARSVLAEKREMIARAERENEQMTDWFTSLDDNTAENLLQKASDSLSGFERRLVGSKGPLESSVLLAAMYRISERSE